MTKVVAITGSLGKTTTCQLISHVLVNNDLYTVANTTQGLYINGQRVAIGDYTTGLSARQVIQSNPDYAILEFGRGGLNRTGMVIQSCNIGVLLNIKNTQLGIDGIDTKQQMMNIKKIVIQSATDLVIIGDDEYCLQAIKYLEKSKLCIITTKLTKNIQQHIDNGYKAVVYDGKYIYYYTDNIFYTFDPQLIPASYNGKLFPIINAAMVTIAVCHQLGLDYSLITKQLSCFVSDYTTNIGRHNFFHKQIDILGTWADGSDALDELVKFVYNYDIKGKRIIVITAMEERTDQYIIDMGKSVAGNFDNYICCEPHVKRGRKTGEVTALLELGLLDNGVNPKNIYYCDNVPLGIKKAVEQSFPGDFILIDAVLKAPEIEIIQQIIY